MIGCPTSACSRRRLVRWRSAAAEARSLYGQRRARLVFLNSASIGTDSIGGVQSGYSCGRVCSSDRHGGLRPAACCSGGWLHQARGAREFMVPRRASRTPNVRLVPAESRAPRSALSCDWCSGGRSVGECCSDGPYNPRLHLTVPRGLGPMQTAMNRRSVTLSVITVHHAIVRLPAAGKVGRLCWARFIAA